MYFIVVIFTDFKVKTVRFYESAIHHGFGAKQAIKYPAKRFQCEKYYYDRYQYAYEKSKKLMSQVCQESILIYRDPLLFIL